MARGKKKSEIEPQNVTAPSGGDEDALQNIQMMEQTIAAAKAQQEQQKLYEHQANNKAHDTEFSEYSEGTGATETLGVVGKEEIHEAYLTLLKYKEEKASIEAKIGENENFWKLNHWEEVYKGEQKAADKRIKPKSAWLFNTIINKHADAMDNYPEANVLPREKSDEEVAKALSDIIPVILEWNDYENTYSDAQWYKQKQGTSVQAVLWNNDLNNGLGDIEVKKVDLLNIFWKGGITDIQDSPNLFYVRMMDNDEIKARYPEINVGNDSTLGLTTIENYHIGADTSNQSAVVDWYYRRRVQTVDELGVQKIKTVLHFCQFCNEQLIYASENDPKYAERGWYDHGKYPFVFDTLYPVEGSIVGMGYIDIEKDDQIYIDKLNQAILESAMTNARPRYFFRGEGAVNEDEFTDLSKPIIHAEDLGQNSILPVVNTQFNAAYQSVYLNKIQEMKDTSGNTASSQGQASSVTSASGIASLQEAAGKLSRDSNSGSYRAYKEIVNLVIELIRQFYDEPRCFRIIGEFGKNEFIQFDNSGLIPQQQGAIVGLDMGSRLPIMDIDVKPQKKNAYTKEAQNQTALNLYNMGFFAPQNTDAALACLDMMDFENIDKVKENITMNGTLYQMVQQLQQQMMQLGAMIDAQNGTSIAPAIAEQSANQINSVSDAKGAGTSVNTSKGSLSTQAAAAARGSASPQ